MTVLGLILARGGSKRIPRKNMRLLGGKPLIQWTIEAAQKARNLHRIVVSTDNEEIADFAIAAGVKFLGRPVWMCADHVSPYPSILHALDVYPSQYVCLLQPTSPFRASEDINECVQLAYSQNGAAAVTAQRGEIEPNGAVYVGRFDWLLKGGNFDHPRIPYWYMPAERSLDIDTEEDWTEAERLLKAAA